MTDNIKLEKNKKNKNLTGSTFNFEKKLFEDGYEIVIGIDEVGRGPLAGPVVASAVACKCHAEFISASQEILKQVQDDNSQISNEQDFYKKVELIKDSKMLSEKQRESLFDFIHENFYVGVGICDHLTIDRVNILEASFLAMKKAIASLNSKFPMTNDKQIPNAKFQNVKKIILVDGNKAIPNISIEQKSIIGGDKIVKSISAASIVAKVTRDRIMVELDKIYPQYGFLKHKGYGTSIHVKALDSFGPCEIHRRSFKPVRIRLGKMRKNA